MTDSITVTTPGGARQVIEVDVGRRGPPGPAVDDATLGEALNDYFDANGIDGSEIEWDGAPAPILTYQNAKA